MSNSGNCRQKWPARETCALLLEITSALLQQSFVRLQRPRKVSRVVARVQVSAHGTGAGIPPVDEQVVRLKLITPAMGSLELSSSQSPRLFRLAKVGLGLLGVVSELTLQCVDAHELLEQTSVTTLQVTPSRLCFGIR